MIGFFVMVLNTDLARSRRVTGPLQPAGNGSDVLALTNKRERDVCWQGSMHADAR